MLNAEERRRWRREYVDGFLAQLRLQRDALAPSTQKCLDQWARQVKLVADQPSSNFGNVVLELCKAVESELASGLGTIRGLEFLARGTLGEKAHALKGITAFDDATTQRISSQGIKPDFVKSGLADSLKQLASLRSDTGSAHGNAQLQSASPQHADRARLLTGQILKGIVRVSRGKSK